MAHRAVVTGAAQGIGAAIADRLRGDGMEVIAVDRRPPSASGPTSGPTSGSGSGSASGPGSGSGSGGPAGSWAVCDITDADAVNRLAADVGPVDVLVNNAGIWRFSPLVDTSLADARAVLEVNLLGTLLCCQAFGRSMIAAGRGSIVNIVSTNAEQVSPGTGIYPASKAAVLALTRQIALEWGPLGVRANAVGPGLVPTEGTGNVYDDPAVRAARSSAIPLRRLAAPADIADTVAFFASDRSSYVNGQVVYVDGGLTQGLMGLLPRPAATGGPQVDERGPAAVVRRHLAAVVAQDLTGMSADYRLDAVLHRPGASFTGRESIAGYFETVGPRLGGGRVVAQDPVTGADGRVVVHWRLEGGPGHGTTGTDTYVVSDGWITEQTVVLDATDF